MQVIGRPELHLVNPSSSANPLPTDTLVYSFPGVDSVFGITEFSPDVFAVAVGKYSAENGPTNGSWSVWSVELGSRHGGSGKKVKKIADVKDAWMINGVAALNDHVVLLADSYAMNVIALDARTAKYDVVLQDPSMASNMSAYPPIGINGMKVVHDDLYFTNSQLGTINRVRLNLDTGHAVGPFTVIASNVTVVDDLAVTEKGDVYVGRPLDNEVVKVGRDGSVVKVADVKGATAASLGRTSRDRGVVYVSTMGGIKEGGGFEEGGKIVALDLC